MRGAGSNAIRSPEQYQLVAGRLITYHLRKQVYGAFEPPKLKEIVKKNIEAKMYEPMLLEWYSDKEWKLMERWIDHKSCLLYTSPSPRDRQKSRIAASA